MINKWMAWGEFLIAVIVLAFVLFGCENPNEARDRKFFNMCPPGNACLSSYFAVNRLKRDLWVRFNGERFVQAKPADKDALVLHQDGIMDFWRVPEYVVATPGPKQLGVPGNESSRPTPGAHNPD